ncbi:hypothetical protein [Bacillus infantis]|uniref:hypothetical protein n=1 Tax=Bacillus infantis TaxID=324767 RepID=UPI003CF75A60
MTRYIHQYSKISSFFGEYPEEQFTLIEKNGMKIVRLKSFPKAIGIGDSLFVAIAHLKIAIEGSDEIIFKVELDKEER